MIRTVTVVNHLGESLVMDLRFPEKSGFLIRNISGLGPAKANINSTDIATNDGSVFSSAKLNTRNIVLDLIFIEKPTIEDTRHLSYKFFPVKKKIKLIFQTDTRLCEAEGFVESNEPDIFSSAEGAQISILCMDPYLYSSGELGTTITSFQNILPGFEFPFSNESLTKGLIEFGLIRTQNTQTVRYSGDAEIGIKIVIHVNGPASGIRVYNLKTNETMVIDSAKLEALTGSPIQPMDEIVINTVKRAKSVKLLRNGKYTNILNCIDKNANWFVLSKGDNVFGFYAESGLENLTFRIENQQLYEGI